MSTGAAGHDGMALLVEQEGVTACHAQVVEASMLLVEDNNAVGRILMVHVNGRFYDWNAPKGNLQQIRGTSLSGMHKASAFVDV